MAQHQMNMMQVTDDGVKYNAMIYQMLPPPIAKYQMEHIHDRWDTNFLSASVVCLIIATLATGLRFLSRRMVKAGCGADDWAMLVALVITFGYSAALYLGIYQYGGSGHAILLSDPVKFSQSIQAAECLYMIGIATVKISTCLLFRRIFPSKCFHRFLYLLAGLITIYSVITVFASIFQCRPIKAAWDPSVKGDCVNIELLWEIMGGMNVLTDVALLIAPLPHLWKLQISCRQKAQVMGIFCVGGFITVVSAYRIVKLNGMDVLDAPWTIAPAAIWSLVEVCIAIACACAVTYRPLFNHVFNLKPTRAYSSESNQSPRGPQQGSESHSIGLSKVKAVYQTKDGKSWSQLDDTEAIIPKGPVVQVSEV